MKSYFAASAAAVLACLYIVVAAEAPAAPATAVTTPPAAAWPAAATVMARLPEGRWLLRAMSAAGCAGTLAASPCEPPPETRSL
jgi:hypothetical protein